MPQVLIVDDQPVFRRQLREVLTRAGLEVVGEAGDIPTAEQLVRTLQPDLAVVDVMLPGMSGLAGITLLKALRPALRIYVVSAYQDQASVFQLSARAAGAEGFFAKDQLEVEVVRAWGARL